RRARRDRHPGARADGRAPHGGGGGREGRGQHPVARAVGGPQGLRGLRPDDVRVRGPQRPALPPAGRGQEARAGDRQLFLVAQVRRRAPRGRPAPRGRGRRAAGEGAERDRGGRAQERHHGAGAREGTQPADGGPRPRAEDEQRHLAAARLLRNRGHLQGLLCVREVAGNRHGGRHQALRRGLPEALGPERPRPSSEGEEMRAATAVLALILGAPLLLRAQDIPDHPDKLKYPPLKFEVPDAAKIRTTLSTGTPAYLMEDPSLPIIDLRILIRGGSFGEPAGKAGVADLTADLLRTGGTTTHDPNAVDEEIDFLAANVAIGVDDLSGSASLSILSKDLDKGLEILMDLLRNPAFRQDKLDTARAQTLDALKSRNDRTSSIEAREVNLLFY